MSGFEWDSEIGKARMKGNKTTQVFNHCTKKLIPSLNERRAWVFYVRALNPERDEILQPEFHEEHYFKYIGRWFVLRHDAKKQVWRLCFLSFVKDPSPGGDLGEREEQGVEAREHVETEQNHRPGGDEANAAAVTRSQLATTPAPHAASYSCVRARVHKWREAAIIAKWNLLDAMERAQERVLTACASLRLRRRKAAASLTAIVRDVREAAANAPRKVAALQHRRVVIEGVGVFDLCVFAPEAGASAWLAKQAEPATP